MGYIRAAISSGAQDNGPRYQHCTVRGTAIWQQSNGTCRAYHPRLRQLEANKGLHNPCNPTVPKWGGCGHRGKGGVSGPRGSWGACVRGGFVHVPCRRQAAARTDPVWGGGGHTKSGGIHTDPPPPRCRRRRCGPPVRLRWGYRPGHLQNLSGPKTAQNRNELRFPMATGNRSACSRSIWTGVQNGFSWGSFTGPQDRWGGLGGGRQRGKGPQGGERGAGAASWRPSHAGAGKEGGGGFSTRPWC